MAIYKLVQYVKPNDLIFDAQYGLWRKSVTILDNMYSFADIDPQRVCTMINYYIFTYMSAYNRGTGDEEEFIEFHAQDILPLTTLFLERLRRA
jgi:hypothetical protein